MSFLKRQIFCKENEETNEKTMVVEVSFSHEAFVISQYDENENTEF